VHQLDYYIKNVLSGKEIVGGYIFMAVKRHTEDLKKKDFPFVYDQSKADIVIDFCQMCRHWKGTFAGERIQLEGWQKFLISMLYGWRRKDGTKRFREAYIDMGRKNAKTTICALLALFEITLSGVAGAQVYCGATKEDQAIILVNDAGKIAKKTPELVNRLDFYEYKGQVKRVVNKATASFIAPLGRDSNTQDGFDPSMGIMDEYHAHKTDEVKNIIDSGMGARLDPLMLQITTAGFNKNGPCFKFRRHAIDILKGFKKDDTLFIAIYTLDEDDDWMVFENWKKSNPLSTLNFEYLKDRFQKAVNEGGTKEVDFKTKNLNLWVDSSDTFIKEELLLSLMSEVQISDFDGLTVYGGLDLGVTKDFSALSIAAETNERIITKTWLWLTEKRYNDLKSELPDIVEWKNKGYVFVTPGNAADHNAVADFIARGPNAIMKSILLKKLAFDRFNSIGIINMMDSEGVPMLAMGQGPVSMNPPICEIERRSEDGLIVMDKNQAMVWMYRNLVVVRDTLGNRKFEKSDPDLHVDGPVSQAMAIGALVSDKIDSMSKYNSDDLLVL
jgi:phage terminase large subunit-like protein